MHTPEPHSINTAGGAWWPRVSWPWKLPWFPVFGGVVEPNFAAGTLLGGVGDAGVERAGINVEADGALIEFPGIEDAMHGRQRIDRTGVRHIHLDCIRGLDGGFAFG